MGSRMANIAKKYFKRNDRSLSILALNICVRLQKCVYLKN